MSKIALYVAGIIFGLIALVHLYRFFYHFHLIIGSEEVPVGASLIGAIIFGLLSIWMFASTCCSKNKCCK